MFYTRVSFCSQGGSLFQHAPQVTWPGGSLSGGVLCPVGGLCPGGSLSGWRSLSGGVSVRETPRMVMSGRYASYWNAFLFKYKGTSPSFLETTDTGAIVFGRLISLFWTYDDATLKVESKIILCLTSMVLYYFTVVDNCTELNLCAFHLCSRKCRVVWLTACVTSRMKRPRMTTATSATRMKTRTTGR